MKVIERLGQLTTHDPKSWRSGQEKKETKEKKSKSFQRLINFTKTG